MARDRTVSVERVIDAPASAIFSVLTDPSMHPAIDGSGTVTGTLGRPRPLRLGSRFGMSMRIGVPYPIRNTVIEFEQDRRIAWRHFARHVWRYQLEPLDDGRTRVTETFDWSRNIYRPVLQMLDVPAINRRGMIRTLERLEQVVTEGAAPD